MCVCYRYEIEPMCEMFVKVGVADELEPLYVRRTTPTVPKSARGALSAQSLTVERGVCATGRWPTSRAP